MLLDENLKPLGPIDGITLLNTAIRELDPRSSVSNISKEDHRKLEQL
jgi:hypothetical protein